MIWFTRLLILITVVVWICWDAWAYVHYGNPATESANIYIWAFRAPGVSFLVGVLCGHLFIPQTEVIKEVADELAKGEKK